jgi:hypothetical protein
MGNTVKVQKVHQTEPGNRNRNVMDHREQHRYLNSTLSDERGTEGSISGANISVSFIDVGGVILLGTRGV